MNKPLCIVAGVGPGNGMSLCRRFGEAGHTIAMLARDASALRDFDGVVDMPRTREMLPDKSDDYFLQPAAIAEAAYQLSLKDASAWTFEIDLRPNGESR